jgi:hypothetical protein
LKYLFLLFSLLPLIALCQDKKDDQIIITPSDTSNLYDQMANLLIAEGYQPDLKERKSNFISTKQKTIGKYSNTVVSFNARIVDNTVLIWGYYQSGSGLHALTYGSSFTPGWEEMDRLAKRLGTVTYAQRQRLR